MTTCPLPAEKIPPGPSAEEVAAFLADNPGFLAEHPELYRRLQPPRRLHGERLADHMAAMLEAERTHAQALEAEVRAALQAGRAGAGFTVRVRLAVLALIRAQDIHEVVTQELPALLGVETCSLAAETAPAPVLPVVQAGIRPLPPGAVGRLIGRGRDAVVRPQPDDLALLHGEAAPLVLRDALARVPFVGPTPVLIAIGAREPAALPLRQTVAVLAFLGRAVAAALSR